MRYGLILAITSPTAFLTVDNTLSIELALRNLMAIGVGLPISIVVSQEQSEALGEFLRTQNLVVGTLICEPSDPHEFAGAIQPSSVDVDAFVIHDASRPLTSRTQFDEVLAAFNNETDAVRPTTAFTETLKILDANSIIKKTLDRSSVLRISTPEIIRVSAIDFTSRSKGWFLPLRKDARTLYIPGHPAGIRINTVEDRMLMELDTI